MANNNYKPNKKDLLKISKKKGCFKVSGDKVFATLQGEGLLESEGGTAGCPAVFFRLHYCNLHCGQPDGWKCDTGYTWDTGREEYWKEPKDWTVEKAKEEIEKAWKEKFVNEKDSKKRLVITGGEPLLQQDLIIKLLEKMPEWKVEIETNGTIAPKKALWSCQINCSPKLNNSGNEKKIRLKPEVLKKINNWPILWFKFVVDELEDVDEIEKIAVLCQLKPEKILIMPEGLTKETVETHQRLIEKGVLRKGWKVVKRNHLLWYGPKRRT